MNNAKYPVFLICGKSNAGKDALAELVAKHLPGTALLAHADPMKRLAHHVFGFTDDQLWGPSTNRNAPDPRYAEAEAWNEAWRRLCEIRSRHIVQEFTHERHIDQLNEWFWNIAKAHGFYRATRDGVLTEGGFSPHHVALRLESKPHLAPRWAVQTIGTEWGRRYDSAMWTRYVSRIADTLLHDPKTTYDRGKGIVPRNAGFPLNRPRPTTFVGITDGRMRDEVLSAKRQGWLTVLVVDPNAVDKTLASGVPGHNTEAELGEVPHVWYNFVVENDKTQGLATLEYKAARLASALVGGDPL